MIPAKFLDLIENYFHEEEKQVIVACLLQEKRVLDALTVLDHREGVETNRLKNIENWRPAYFAFVLKDEANWKYDLEEIIQQITPKGNTQVTQFQPEEISEDLELDLAHAIDIAQRLFTLITTKAWQSVEETLFHNFRFNRNAGLVAACLLGLVGHDEFVQNVFMGSSNLEVIKTFCYGLFCNPLPNALVQTDLARILANLRYEEKSQFLRFLLEVGKGTFVQSLVADELKRASGDAQVGSHQHLSDALEQLQEFNYLADVYYLAEQETNSVNELDQLLQQLDVISQSVLTKKEAVLSERETKQKVLPGYNDATCAYNWKTMPQLGKTLDLKKPEIKEIEAYLKDIEEQISNNPKGAMVLRQVADFYSSLGDHHRTLHYLRLAKILDADDQDLNQKLFELAMADHRWQDALIQVKEKKQAADEQDLTLTQFYLECKALLENKERDTVRQRLEGMPTDLSSMDAVSSLRMGELWMDVEGWERAQLCFKHAILNGSTDYAAWINSYRCLLKSGHRDEAQQILSQAFELFHERKDFYETSILAMLECGEEDRGLALLEKIDLEHGCPDAIAGIIQYVEKKGCGNHAYELAMKASSHFPLNAKLGMVTAQVLMENGESEQAGKYLKLVKDEKERDHDYILLDAIALLKSSPSIFPLGTQRVSIDELDSIAHKIDPLPEGDYWKELVKAEVHYLEDNTQGAISKYKELILKNSLNANRENLWRAQAGLAKAMMKINQTETAITLLNEALRSNPENLAIYDLLVAAYGNKNLNQEAVELIRKAYKTCSSNKRITGWYVDQMLKFGQTEEVRKYFSKEAAQNHSSIEFLIEKMRFENQFGSQDETKASIHALLLLERIPTQDLHTMLKVAQDVDFKDLSLKIIQRLQKMNEDDPETCLMKASVYWNQGEHATAVDCLDQLGKDKNWNLLKNAVVNLADDHTENPEALLQTLKNRQDVNAIVQNLPEHVHSVLPSEWISAFSSDEIWIKKLLLSFLTANNEDGNLAFPDSSGDLQIHDVQTQAYLAIWHWYAKGNADNYDWIDILERLKGSVDQQKIIPLIGIVLNILLENGNEIAAAALIDALPDIYSSIEPNTTFAKARVLQKNHNHSDAQIVYQRALGMIQEVQNDSCDLDASILAVFTTLPIWKANCAFEMGDWETAVRAYFYCLGNANNLPALKEMCVNRLLVMGFKEWSYGKTGANRNIPKIFAQNEFHSLSEQITLLPQEKQSAYLAGHNFLINGTCSVFEREQDGLIGSVCKLLDACQRGQYEEAIQILETNPKETDLPLVALGMFPKEKYRDLIPAFHAAMIADKKNAFLSAGLAQIFIHENETDVAIDALETAVGLIDREATWHRQLAMLYEEKKELQKATVCWKRAVSLDPENEDAKKRYLQSLLLNKEFSNGIGVFEKDKELFTGDSAILREIVNAYYETGELRKASGYLSALKNAGKEDLELLLIQARIAEKLENIPKAMELIRDAYRLDPKSPEVIVELAKIKSLEEDEGFGLEIIEKALESDIINDQLILGKTAYLERIRGKKRAIDFLEGYLEKAANPDTSLLNRYADLLFGTGNKDESLKIYESSIQKDDNQSEIHRIIGMLSMKNGNLDNALFHLNKAIQQDPHDMEAYLALTDVLINRREIERAEKIIKTAIEQCKEHYLIYEKASKVYNQLNDSEKAEIFLRKATALNPMDDDLREKLGIILEKRIFNKE